jgi:hypothetical protein
MPFLNASPAPFRSAHSARFRCCRERAMGTHGVANSSDTKGIASLGRDGRRPKVGWSRAGKRFGRCSGKPAFLAWSVSLPDQCTNRHAMGAICTTRKADSHPLKRRPYSDAFMCSGIFPEVCEASFVSVRMPAGVRRPQVRSSSVRIRRLIRCTSYFASAMRRLSRPIDPISSGFSTKRVMASTNAGTLRAGTR